MTIVALNDEEKSPRWKARNLNPFGIISFIEIIGSEYLKLFVANCKNVYKLSCRRSLSFCNKTMPSLFYMLMYQVELRDHVFFSSVELLNKFLEIYHVSCFYKFNIKMDQRLDELLEANKHKIENKFDYLFIYLHAYIENCFPQKQNVSKPFEDLIIPLDKYVEQDGRIFNYANLKDLDLMLDEFFVHLCCLNSSPMKSVPVTNASSFNLRPCHSIILPHH